VGLWFVPAISNKCDSMDIHVSCNMHVGGDHVIDHIIVATLLYDIVFQGEQVLHCRVSF
jgi:hypothetical protein